MILNSEFPHSIRFTRFVWANLAYNLLVVLFGAFVRATGSGAGCGAHWPTCQGVVIPRAPAIETVIEFTHRATSGLAMLLVLVMVIFAWRVFPRGHRVRKAAVLSAVFMLAEALFGAGLVLLGLVDDNDSMARALAIVFHLVNTFALLAAITLTARWSQVREGKGRAKISGLLIAAILLGLLGVVFLGASGAITALGDTLFPAESLLHGLQQDADPSAHFLLRLRVYHPLIAALTGIYLYAFVGYLRRKYAEEAVQQYTLWLLVLFGAQIVLGFVNLILLAPVWMQLIHLLVADLVWIRFVLLADLFLSGRLTAQDLAHAPVQEAVQ